ncbi:MAG TPA: hypothetical protein VN714_24065 [Trebonia sp.]|jgi:hypothetical protein|nr:hypothetical protein [Trebonia sp.]
MVTPARRRQFTRLLAATAACVAALAAWRYGPWREKYAVALPPPTASQRQVVLAYLRALDAHDSATAMALSAPSMRDNTQVWLANTADITQIKVGAVGYDAHQAAGEQYAVPVDFVYRSHWWKDDPSFEDGEHDWGYLLASINGRWLITDDGLG